MLLPADVVTSRYIYITTLAAFVLLIAHILTLPPCTWYIMVDFLYIQPCRISSFARPRVWRLWQQQCILHAFATVASTRRRRLHPDLHCLGDPAFIPQTEEERAGRETVNRGRHWKPRVTNARTVTGEIAITTGGAFPPETSVNGAGFAVRNERKYY